jgi:molybdopterin-guanine dinucleotide biosynthesis protein A
MSSVETTGIVLAGGRASRFGIDKLAVPIAGRPLLHHAILAVASVVDEIVVVIGPDGASPRLPTEAAGGVRVVRDAVADGGPLVGLVAGLAAARGPLALLVGGDQPSLSPAVLAELLLWLGPDAEQPQLDAVALEEDGLVRPLPAAFRVATVHPVAAALVDGGARSLMALLDQLRVGTLPPDRWRMLDPTGASLRDVDTPGDIPAS